MKWSSTHLFITQDEVKNHFCPNFKTRIQVLYELFTFVSASTDVPSQLEMDGVEDSVQFSLVSLFLTINESFDKMYNKLVPEKLCPATPAGATPTNALKS